MKSYDECDGLDLAALVGTTMSAAFGNEALLFRLAAQLEQARPWAQRKPG